MCDGTSNTISLIKSKNGQIFGGYTALAWDSSNAFASDPDAFVFQMNKRTKHNAKDGSYCSVFMNEEYMMIFGCGDIVICDQCNMEERKVKSCSRFGSEYEIGDIVLPSTKEALQNYMCGSFEFIVDEIEVYKIVFCDSDIHKEFSRGSVDYGDTPGKEFDTPDRN